MDSPCAVCRLPSNGFHFGVEVCSACSAFFRRVVIKNRKFRCWGANSGKCEIVAKSGSSMCKSCRFEKCLAVGMRREIVQSGREVYGKRESTSPENSLVPVSQSVSNFKWDKSAFPMLDTIMETYSKVEKIRIGMHQGKNESMFAQRVPKPLNYQEAIAVFLKEYYLVGDWFSHCFPDFGTLEEDQKDILHRSFYLQFMLLESGFFSCKHKKSNIRYLPSGDFIDCAKPETYYIDPEGKQNLSTEKACKMFSPSCQCYRRNVTAPMVRENTDRFEFLALTGLALFDADLENISEETSMTCRKNRQKIQREMLKYYLSTRNLEDATVRLGNILSIIPSLQRAARLFVGNMELKKMMNAFSVDPRFYDNCIPKFSTF